MLIHGHAKLETHDGIMVLSQVVDQSGPFDVVRHKKTHQRVYYILIVHYVKHDIELVLDFLLLVCLAMSTCIHLISNMHVAYWSGMI